MDIQFAHLPDVNKIPPAYDAYGRFGITTSGNLFVLRENSSHPGNTEFGGYYAVNYKTRTLTLSPRGVALGFEDRITETPVIVKAIRNVVRM